MQYARVFRSLIGVSAFLLMAGCAVQERPHAGQAAVSPPPATKKRPTTDTFHGVPVTEEYRWLEDWDRPEVQTWNHTQNAYARTHLDTLSDRSRLEERIGEVLGASMQNYFHLNYVGGKLFAEKYAPPKQQSYLVVFDHLDQLQSERRLLDPETFDPSGHTTIDWYVPSHDGRLVAVSLSKGGTESGDVSIYSVATGQRVYETITRVNGGTAGGDLAWAPDNKGFYYTRYPRAGERPQEDMNFYQQLYFHRLGSNPNNDRYELGKDLPRIAEVRVLLHPGSGRVIASIQKGDGGEFEHHLRSPKGRWKKFSAFGDGIIQANFGPKNSLYLLSRHNAPRGKVLLTSAKKPNPATARVLIPESSDTIIESFWDTPSIRATPNFIYVLYQQGGPSTIRTFYHDGTPARTGPKSLPISSVSEITPIGEDDILFRNSSFTHPTAVYRYIARSATTVVTPLASTPSIDFDGVQVIREFATSKDGTKIPINILLPKDVTLDGNTPIILYGYGGYGVSLSPWFSTSTALLLEQGIGYAIANIRGGGEFGERWHRQGNLTNKQNVFDDFSAAAEHLIERGYTNPDRLGLRGGSNGGLLMGATVVQAPTLARVVVSHVGIYDMLRVELSPNGAFNITEFGTVKNPEHFQALRAYSPYHNVEGDTPYPAMMFMTGQNDPRVDPMQSRKMVAAMQAASTSRQPILLRTSSNSGHGGGTPLKERINQLVDEYSFYMHHLNVDFKEYRN
jgi:prolyl oligopeptidase